MSNLGQLTYQDLQYTPADGKRYELVDGELFVSAAPIPLHQRIVMTLSAPLPLHVRERRVGELFVASCDIVFAPSTVLEPDIFFVSPARLHIIGEKYVTGPPDLVVEVLSEGSARTDRQIKFKQYTLYGVPESWLIDPYGRTLQVFRSLGGERQYEPVQLLGSGDTLTSPLFPDFGVPLGTLWEGLQRARLDSPWCPNPLEFSEKGNVRPRR
jgi:Uma2 family endonuclease